MFCWRDVPRLMGPYDLVPLWHMTTSFGKFSTVEAHERRGSPQTRPPVGVVPLVPYALSNLPCWHPVPPPHNVVYCRRGRFQGVTGLGCLCTPIRRWTMRSDVGVSRESGKSGYGAC